MKSVLHLLVLAPVILPAAVMAAPADAANTLEARFTLADADRSGGLSKAELAGAAAPGFPIIAKNFDVMDTNKDGQVTLAERNGAINTYMQKQQAVQAQAATKARKDFEDRFAKADTNKDGALSKKEASSAAAPGFPVMNKNFDAMDKDRNGKVTISERENFLRDESRRQIDKQQAEAQKKFEASFAVADTNKSGGLSKKELDSAQSPGFPLIKKNFDAMDTDKNGQVTVAERNAFMARR